MIAFLALAKNVLICPNHNGIGWRRASARNLPARNIARM